MTLFLIVGGVVIAMVLALLRALALDEVRGRIQRRVEASVEATISSLPPQLQEEWAEEWRAELNAVKSMPLSALAFAHGLRETSIQLAGEAEPAPVRAGGMSAKKLASPQIKRTASQISNSDLFIPFKKRWVLINIVVASFIASGAQRFLGVEPVVIAVSGLGFATGLVLLERSTR